MDKITLVEKDLEDGRRLIQTLDEARFPIVAALWYYLSEEGIWRLILASPVAKEDGPLAAYASIQAGIKRLNPPIDIPLLILSAVSPDEPLINDLRFFAGTPCRPYIGGTHLRKTRVGDSLIEGAYVYRAEQVVGETGSFKISCAIPVAESRRKKWRAFPAEVINQDGWTRDVKVNGIDWPHSYGKQGIKIRLNVVKDPKRKGDKVLGDITRWTVHNGKLLYVENIATEVEIQGLPDVLPHTGRATG